MPSEGFFCRDTFRAYTWADPEKCMETNHSHGETSITFGWEMWIGPKRCCSPGARNCDCDPIDPRCTCPETIYFYNELPSPCIVHSEPWHDKYQEYLVLMPLQEQLQ